MTPSSKNQQYRLTAIRKFSGINALSSENPDNPMNRRGQDGERSHSSGFAAPYSVTALTLTPQEMAW